VSTGELGSLEAGEAVGQVQAKGRLPVPDGGGGIGLVLQGVEEALELVRPTSRQSETGGEGGRRFP
jgi:hypothetical protein